MNGRLIQRVAYSQIFQNLNGKGPCFRNLTLSSPLYKIEKVKTPNFPESISEGDIRWSKKIGVYVKIDEIIGEIDTDKTSLPVVSPFNGALTELLFADGSKVSKGDYVCTVDTDAKPPADEAPTKTKSAEPVKQVASSSKKEEVKTSSPVPTTSTSSYSTQASIGSSSDRSETRVPMTRIRQTIAGRLKESQNTNAMLTTFNELDMTAAIEMRNKYKDRFLKEYGVKLGFMSMFLNASIYALKVQPVVNSVIVNNEIIYRNYIDISVAVSGNKGLVVPVIRNVQNMNIVEMEKAVAELAEKARKNQLQIEDMEGGTFTVSNGGVFGSMFSTPIINMPQSAILGMHATKDRPVVVNGKIEIRPIMYLALTYDHRLIDGREAVIFLKRIKDAIEDPSSLIMGM